MAYQQDDFVKFLESVADLSLFRNGIIGLYKSLTIVSYLHMNLLLKTAVHLSNSLVLPISCDYSVGQGAEAT